PAARSPPHPATAGPPETAPSHHPGVMQLLQLLIAEAELAQHLIGVFAEAGPGPADRSAGAAEPREDVLHLDLSQHRMVDAGDRLAGPELRIGQHLLGAVDLSDR